MTGGREARGGRARPPASLVLALALALGACGTATVRTVETWRWDRPDTTEEVFRHDRSYCLRGAATQEAVPRFLDPTRVDPDRFAACMAARGYTRSETGRF